MSFYIASLTLNYDDMIGIEHIKASLAAYSPKSLQDAQKRPAAVAMLLTETHNGPEVLFIRRAEYQGDPWSGDVAFPGGGIEAQDSDPQQAAVRETWEEIGLQLSQQQYIGQLDDLAGAYLPVQVSCFIYLLPEKPNLQLNHEVVDTFWVPLSELLNPQRHRLESFEFRGRTESHPIVDLEGYCERFLWGITYRLFKNFFTLTGLTY